MQVSSPNACGMQTIYFKQHILHRWIYCHITTIIKPGITSRPPSASGYPVIQKFRSAGLTDVEPSLAYSDLVLVNQSDR